MQFSEAVALDIPDVAEKPGSYAWRDPFGTYAGFIGYVYINTVGFPMGSQWKVTKEQIDSLKQHYPAAAKIWSEVEARIGASWSRKQMLEWCKQMNL